MIMGTLSAASVLANSLFAAPVALAAEQPSVDAKAAFVIEDETDKVLVNQNGEEALGIASMTKMLSIDTGSHRSRKIDLGQANHRQ